MIVICLFPVFSGHDLISMCVCFKCIKIINMVVYSKNRVCLVDFIGVSVIKISSAIVSMMSSWWM